MNDILLEVNNLSKTYTRSSLLFDTSFQALKPISFKLERNETIAVLGKNGSGKSTLAKLIAGATKPSSGEIFLHGKQLNYGDFKYRSKKIRMVFQDPNLAFNHIRNIGLILDTPLRLLTDLNKSQRDEKIFSTLKKVGISPEYANLKIRDLSLSQKQSVGLARALILDPEIIIIDDILSSLDTSLKNTLTNLMLDLQKDLGLSYLYAGQDIGLIKHISDKIMVLQEGEMIEFGDSQQLLCEPKQPLTQRIVKNYFPNGCQPDLWR